MLGKDFAGRGCAKVVHTDDSSIETGVFVPEIGLGSLNRHSGTYGRRQDALSVRGVLGIKDFRAGHGYHPHSAALG